MIRLRSLIVAMLIGLLAINFSFAAEEAKEAAKEVKPLKVLLVLGGCCHDYAKQKDILKAGLEKRANVVVEIAYDPDKGTKHLNPVYEKEEWAKGFDLVIHNECSADVKDMDIVKRILKPHAEGTPGVVLHCGMHSYRTQGWNDPKTPTPWQEFLGLQSTSHRRQLPIEINYVDKQHPVTIGLANWTTINEELYNNTAGKLLDTAHALARGKQGKDDDIVTWVNVYEKKARVFATTLGHNNDTVADDRYLELVTRGLLWSCHKLNDDGTPMTGYGPKK